MAEQHDPWCKWPTGAPCLRFSTDGTRLGADIAHTMGTMDESAIVRGEAPNDDSIPPFESDIDAEQADWDADEHDYVPCDPDGRSPHTKGEPGPHPHYDEGVLRAYNVNSLEWS